MNTIAEKFIRFAALLFVVAAPFGVTQAQTARVQIIHNAADPAAAEVDIYVGETLAVDDFAFRAATPFIDLTAASEIVIGIAPGSSSSAADVIASFPVTLDMDRTYTVIANGVLDPASFAANPDGRATGFNLWIKADSREAAEDASMIDFFATHGATDAPTVDVVARGVGTLVDSAAYGDITDYLSVPPASFILDVRPAGSPTIVASYDLDLSSLAGGAAAIVASGFLDPSANQDGAAFGLVAVLPDGMVLELPASETAATARGQVIHNAADPGAEMVDVYLGDVLAIPDFAFRDATPFIDLPAGQEVVIGIAPGNSGSSADVIAEFPVTLEATQTYTVIANGVLDPAGFDPNPDGRDIAFTLWVKEATRETADDSASVEFFAVHGATDAPGVDVWARGVAPLVEDAKYGDITDYLAVPPASYTLDVQPAGSPVIVASYVADLSGLAGGAAAIVASGFLGDASFGLLAVLPDGTVLELPASEEPATADVQIIHNAADPGAASVDVYLDETLAIPGFAFRTATEFLALPAGDEFEVGIAPPGSGSVADAIATFPFTLQAGETYTVIANGVLDPSAFAANPDGRETAFGLWVNPMTRQVADDPASVEFFVVHGATDAPAVDVEANAFGKSAALIVENAAYGDITEYLAVPPASYVLDVKVAGTETIAASFLLEADGLAGGSAAVLASGFLDPSANNDGEAFNLIVVLADGTVVEPRVVTATEELGAEVPTGFRVNGNYPNPFNPSTNVQFDLPSASTVSLQVFDMLGRQVLATEPTELAAGSNQQIRINAIDLPSGTYVYRVSATSAGTEAFDTGTMLLLK